MLQVSLKKMNEFGYFVYLTVLNKQFTQKRKFTTHLSLQQLHTSFLSVSRKITPYCSCSPDVMKSKFSWKMDGTSLFGFYLFIYRLLGLEKMVSLELYQFWLQLYLPPEFQQQFVDFVDRQWITQQDFKIQSISRVDVLYRPTLHT